MAHFDKKCPQIFPLMTTFYNFTLKMETSWVKKILKFIL